MHSKHVLIVDDDFATRSGLAELLQNQGYACTAVASFDEAVSALRAGPPDLLITDIRLREYNGLQLVISSKRPVPAIVISGFADPLLEAEARRCGAGYLTKPIDAKDLQDLVEEKVGLPNPMASGAGTRRRLM